MPMMTIQCVAVLVLALGLVVHVRAESEQPSELTEVYEPAVYEADEGGTLPYRLLKPKDYDPKKQYPLVVLLHGAGERGDDNAAQLKWGAWLFAEPAHREAYPCFVLVPQCPAGQTWSSLRLEDLSAPPSEEPAKPMQHVLAVMADLEDQYAIDPSRRYVLGLSMGGYGTWDIIARRPSLFAAAAPVCGGGDASSIANAAAVPVWAFHSSDDPVVPVERTREMVTALREAGGEVTYTEYADAGHASWQPAFRNAGLLPWLFDQRAANPERPRP